MKLKTTTFFSGLVVLCLVAAVPSRAAAELTRFDARGGSKLRLEGTSTAHDWQAESPFIMGFLEVGANFPIEPGQAVTPGKVEAHGEASITVRSLVSIKKDGSRYDEKMDDKMWNMLSVTNHPKLVFRLNDLDLKEVPKDKSAPYLFDAKGDLAVAGVTNKISLTVSVVPFTDKNGEKRLRISGEIPMKMTDFGIQPATMIVVVKTANEVKVKFDWVIGQKKPATAGAK